MARLIVEAFADDTKAARGNRGSLYLITSVTAATGSPTTLLGPANFKITNETVEGYSSSVEIGNWFVETRPGIYQIELLPVHEVQGEATTWNEGVYIFSVAVEKRADRGQTLTKVLIKARY